MKSSSELLTEIRNLRNRFPSAMREIGIIQKLLAWMDDFELRLNSDQVRVAVIGITSSGKSTLLNTILGQKVLPTGVRPSSGKQVLCGYGQELYAEVIFEPTSGRKTIIARKDIDKVLLKYADEDHNPGNREHVDEIRVHSPRFKFPKEVVLVDTPGLDAKDLSEHEKITMKFVLPTVDMVMFLTTVKCDSDGQNLNFIDDATSEKKPLVVVQNKIKSVEPKITRDHLRDKSADDVRREHYERVKKLLTRAKKASVRDAPIVQVEALDGTNIKKLVEVVGEQIRINSKLRDSMLERQFANQLKETVSDLTRMVSDAKEKERLSRSKNAEIARWGARLDELSTLHKTSCEDLEVNSEGIRADARKLIKALDAQYKTSAGYDSPSSLGATIERDRKELVNRINRLFSSFGQQLTLIQEKITRSCKDLNLTETQVYERTFFSAVPVTIDAPTRTIKGAHHAARGHYETTSRVKRFFGWICRQDDWGRKWVEDVPSYTDPDKSVYDIEKLISAIKIACNNMLARISGYRKGVEDIGAAIEKLFDEFQKKKDAFEESFQCQIPLDEGRCTIDALSVCLRSVSKSESFAVENINCDIHDHETVVSSQFTCYECDHLVYDVVRFAREICFRLHSRLVQKTIARSASAVGIICGWDMERCSEFNDVFFSGKAKIVDLALPPPRSESNVLYFIVINIDQIGSTRKKIFDSKESAFIKDVSRRGKLVWVIDAVAGFVLSGTLIEAFVEFVKMTKEFSESPFDVFVCDRNLYYTILFQELYFNIQSLELQNAQQRFVKEMRELFRLTNEQAHQTGQYVNRARVCLKSIAR